MVFQRNYLLDHIRQDGRSTLFFCICFAAAGLYPWLGMTHTPENGSLRFAGATALAISLLGVAIASQPALHPKSHHTVQELKRYGEVDEVLEKLQADSRQAKYYGRLTLGPEWLTARGVGITVVRRDEIAEVQLAETRVTSGGAPVGSNWRLVVTTRDGRVREFPCRNRDIADALLVELD